MVDLLCAFLLLRFLEWGLVLSFGVSVSLGCLLLGLAALLVPVLFGF